MALAVYMDDGTLVAINKAAKSMSVNSGGPLTVAQPEREYAQQQKQGRFLDPGKIHLLEYQPTVPDTQLNN